MTVFKHELRQGRIALLVWTLGIAAMLGICILIFPEMKAEMGTVTKLFANMGAFTAAFGMDKLNFGEFIGFFCIECGNVLGIGGGFYAAMIGVNALAKEEKEHTAEFLLTNPISRTRVITEKWIAVLCQILILNAASALTTVLCLLLIHEHAPANTLVLLFLAYFIAEIEIAAICFGISAYIKNNSLGLGLGLAAVFYFINLASNLSGKVGFLKYITPFGYTDGATISGDGCIPGNYLIVGCIIGVIGVALAYWKYSRKDIA